jgi:hypothetical protein
MRSQPMLTKRSQQNLTTKEEHNGFVWFYDAADTQDL